MFEISNRLTCRVELAVLCVFRYTMFVLGLHFSFNFGVTSMLEGVNLTGADISFIRCSTTSSLKKIDGAGKKKAA